jgi:glycosyltransferase involved in cell wall biosynthesis
VLAVMPNLGTDAGAERSLVAVAPGLVDSGIDLDLALLGRVQTLAPSLRAAGIPVHDLSAASHWRGRVAALRLLVREAKPDLIHATLHEAVVAAEPAALLTNLPILVTWAATPIVAGESERIGALKRLLVRALEAVLGLAARARYHAVTTGVARAQCRSLLVPPRRVRVVERGRDPVALTSIGNAVRDHLRSELGAASDDRIVMCVGRHDVQKGHVRLLDAFEAVTVLRPDTRLVLVGRQGSATPAIEDRLRSMRHAERVVLTGHRDDVPALLQVADVVVCASHREGAAGALIEAMAVGTPIVSVDLDGLDGVLRDGDNALVVPPERLADGIVRALDDPAAAHARAARARSEFVHRFTVARAAAGLADAYRWAAARGKVSQ